MPRTANMIEREVQRENQEGRELHDERKKSEALERHNFNRLSPEEQKEFAQLSTQETHEKKPKAMVRNNWDNTLL